MTRIGVITACLLCLHSLQYDVGQQGRWSLEVEHAQFPGSYNFPVFVVRNEMWAFHPEGRWSSADGRRWTKSALPASGLNTGYQRYVPLNDAVYALGTMTGNFQDLHLTSRIARTRDFKTWDVLARQSNLPPYVFYGAVVHDGAIFLFGGYDGHAYHNDVWRSADAVHWAQITAHAGWSPRNVDMTVVFHHRIWVIGGGVIDGQPEPNPNSKREVWSSADGIDWTRMPDRSGSIWGSTPIVFHDQLWMIGVNRNSTFAPATLMTPDGVTWREEEAPWSPRGAPAVWIFDSKLFMAGGKYSVEQNGRQEFLYRNDVWSMSAR